MHFPLSDWIDAHADCRYNLAKSGMGGVVPGPEVTPAQVGRKSADAWNEELRTALADYLRVDRSRIFMTHGATEANAWVLFYLASRSRGSRRLCRIHLPEYPPLVTAAELAGFRPVETDDPASVALLSLPRNPEGLGWTSTELARWTDGARSVLLDETFREFAGRPSHSEAGSPGLWTTGTFTKFFGADSARVGYAVAPPEEVAGFDRLHSTVLDDIPAFSAASALALLEGREEIARRVRALFNRNRTALRRALPAVPSIDAPVYLDRAPDGDGDALAERCLRASVLVCPGSFFGDPTGVRICLTRPSFRRDLARYIEVRDAGVPAPASATEAVPTRGARPPRAAPARA